MPKEGLKMKTENMKKRDKIACPRCGHEMKFDDVIFQDSCHEPAYIEQYFVCQNPDCGYVDVEGR